MHAFHTQLTAFSSSTELPFPFSLLPSPRYSPDLLLFLDKGLKLGSTRNGNVQCLGREKGLQVKQIKVVVIHQVCQQLVTKAIQCRHDAQGEVPMVVGGAIHKPAQHSETTWTAIPHTGYSTTSYTIIL